MFLNQLNKLLTKQQLRRIQILRIVPTIQHLLVMSVCPTISATMEQSSLMELVLLTSGMDLEVLHQKIVNVQDSLMFAARTLTLFLHHLQRSNILQSVEEEIKMVLELGSKDSPNLSLSLVSGLTCVQFYMRSPLNKKLAMVVQSLKLLIFISGGSLIAPGTILTAAHCVEKFRQNPSQLKIRCGEWDTQNETEPYPHQDRYVEALNIHPEFDGRNLHNDFAVLFTSEDFVLASHIDTVCLPQADELFEESTCFATGWGKDKFGSAGQYQVVLKEIDLPVVSNLECQDRLQSTRLGRKFKLQ